MDFFNSFESGYVTSRIKEIDQLSGLFSVNSFKVLLSILEMVFALFILFKINLILTLILLSLMPIYYVISKKYLSKINDSSYKVAEQNAILNSKMQNTVTGIEEIKNLNVEEKETQKINLESEVLADLSIKQSILFSMGMEFLVFLGSISTVLLLLFGGFSVINNYMTIGGYMIFMNYLPKLYAPMQNISSSILTIQPSLVALKRINEFFELFDIKDNSNEEIEEITEIEFQEVVFSYNTNDKFALEHINFKAKKGDNVLLQGENGSGKSTILKLLIGLYKPKEGEILINNHKFNSYSIFVPPYYLFHPF
uniref:ABC transporter transmembrane domain-containing protein n=1 Tax=Candidatus Enterococcus willemsii TaxID=1857215 RepID=UPI00403FAA94